VADMDNKERCGLDQDLDDVEEVVEEETGEKTKIKAHQLTVQMMQNPQILAALQERLDGLVETPTGHTERLPRVILEEVHDLERKYAVLCQPLFDKQLEIINAIYGPPEEESEWKPDEEEEISEELKEKTKLEDEKKDEEKEDPKGIPEFWWTVFKNIDLLSDMMLASLSFILEFHFEPKEYFTSEVLTKTYRMRSEPDDSDPFSFFFFFHNPDPFPFDGPQIMGCTGCQIDWGKGKNVTLKTIKKKQKHERHGTVCTVTKTVSNDPFFNFFFPDSGDLDDDAEAILAVDFETGHFLREHIIPRSVFYFTGEAIEEDDDDYDEEGEEADEEGENKGNEENNPDYDSKRIKTQQNASNSEASCMCLEDNLH
ncbi:NAP1L1-containing, partial [Ictidomys tridecemlineatus]|uniref:Nucleosome assembly protein 1 like 1 n=1 Tax=Ictidomys tridecemlineatus TaxID=43179 RepID=A0A287D5M0_ICTTR